ncbi:MAG: ATP-binding cassette domain-containing protein [Pseudomonadota bacterium]
MTAPGYGTENAPIISLKHVSCARAVAKRAQRRVARDLHEHLLAAYRPRARTDAKIILDDISFDVHSGERVGLIGRNGAGKSSLLFVLSGTLPLSGGALTVRGTTQSLMNASIGLKNEATGIENIRLNAYRLGMQGEAVDDMVASITEFSELGDALGDPVVMYSAGMRLRLTFAIVTAIQPDILLMDEWIGAGDRHFTGKANARLHDVLDRSRALIIASHNDRLLTQLCSRGLVLHEGKLVFDGPINEALAFYAAA